MADVTYDIEETYAIIDSDNENYGTFIGRVKWNGKKARGIDIRTYDKNKDKLYKGITIKDEELFEVVSVLSKITGGLPVNDDTEDDIEVIEPKEEQAPKQIFCMDDFNHMFNNIRNEEKYTRDEYGILRDRSGRHVIMKRKKL